MNNIFHSANSNQLVDLLIDDENDDDEESSSQDDRSDHENCAESTTTDEETDEQFRHYLLISQTKKTNKRSDSSISSKLKSSKQRIMADNFESSMDQSLDDLIQTETESYLKKAATPAAKVADRQQNQDIEKEAEAEEEEEEEDTDSEAEMETGVRTTKKRAKFTNDELFYDPEADDNDAKWINKNRRNTCLLLVNNKQNKKKTKEHQQHEQHQLEDQTKIKQKKKKNNNNNNNNKKEEIDSSCHTDAVLNCPCCMTVVSMDCQRHEKYEKQFRAMFVLNCTIKEEEVLKFETNKSIEHENRKTKRNSSSKKNRKIQQEEKEEEKEKEKKKEDEKNSEQRQLLFDLYNPVVCTVCRTEIGVYDPKEELYHFFNVLASHG